MSQPGLGKNAQKGPKCAKTNMQKNVQNFSKSINTNLHKLYLIMKANISFGNFHQKCKKKQKWETGCLCAEKISKNKQERKKNSHPEKNMKKMRKKCAKTRKKGEAQPPCCPLLITQISQSRAARHPAMWSRKGKGGVIPPPSPWTPSHPPVKLSPGKSITWTGQFPMRVLTTNIKRFRP